MMLEVKGLQEGQIINIQYGDYDNWVKFTVDEVIPFEKMVTVRCHTGAIEANFSWKPDEVVEVVEQWQK